LGGLNLIDPITLALFQNRLDYIARQMGWVMIRTSRSPIFNQSHDFSCFIADRNGNLVSQADGIPIHTGGGGFAIRALLGAFGDKVSDGDVFVLNDPYVAGGNHLPDWVIARPVFVGSELVAFTCNRAHQSDIGGGAAGTYNSSATEIWHEGLRLPPLRLVERGKTREDLWQLLILNSRMPHFMDGDLRAMTGSTDIGRQLVVETMEHFGLKEGRACFDGVLDHGDSLFREAIEQLPDGVYEGKSGLDDDCFEDMELKIYVKVTITGDETVIDFTGTDDQIRGFKNSSVANTYSSVFSALSTFFDPSIPRNEGTFRSVTVIAPEGTLVNAKPPAPMTMCTVFPAQQIIHAIWEALGTADPSRACAGWGMNAYPLSSAVGYDGRVSTMYHWAGASGGGAVDGRDGFPQVGPLCAFGALILPNAEMSEQLYPVRVRRQELRMDGAGAGKFRGGSGAHYVADIMLPSEIAFRAEAVKKAWAYGTNGGNIGTTSTVTLTPADGETYDAPTYGVIDIEPSRLDVTSGGGGGWGDPLDRDPEWVLRDVFDEIISVDSAQGTYGVVLDAAGTAVDAERTEDWRRALRDARQEEFTG
jgi:N-methylhydantoinase B